MADQPRNFEHSLTWRPSGTVPSDSRALNPYAPPALVELTAEGSDAEQIRREYLSHEASVRSFGSLCLLGSSIPLTVFGIGLVAAIADWDPGAALVYGIFLGLSGLQFYTGDGLRRLRAWSRWVAIVFSALGATVFSASAAAMFPASGSFAVTIGTMISVCFLYLLLCRKGTMVFSEEYAAVRAATSHIRYRTPAWVWAVVVTIVIALWRSFS